MSFNIVIVCLSAANALPVATRARLSTAQVCMLTAHREHAYVEDTSNAVLAQIKEYFNREYHSASTLLELTCRTLE